MNRAWGLPVIAICLAVASPAIAGEAPATGCSDAARGCASQAEAAKPRGARSNADKLLYAILLGCLLVTGNQASRRRAARAVFS